MFKEFVVKKGIPYTIVRHELSYIPEHSERYFKTVFKNKHWLIKISNDLHIYEYTSEPWIYPSYKVSVTFNSDYSYVTSVFKNITEKNYNLLKLNSLTGLGTDQALFSNLLSDREGFIFHGNGVSVDGKTYLFSGDSGNGKSTISNILLNKGADIFSDDRSIVRKLGENFYSYGNCIHPGHISKPKYKNIIDGVFFVEHSNTNKIELIKDKNIKYKLALKSLVKSFMKKDKMLKSLDLVHKFIDIPFYKLGFNLNGEIYNKIKELR